MLSIIGIIIWAVFLIWINICMQTNSYDTSKNRYNEKKFEKKFNMWGRGKVLVDNIKEMKKNVPSRYLKRKYAKEWEFDNGMIIRVMTGHHLLSHEYGYDIEIFFDRSKKLDLRRVNSYINKNDNFLLNLIIPFRLKCFELFIGSLRRDAYHAQFSDSAQVLVAGDFARRMSKADVCAELI